MAATAIVVAGVIGTGVFLKARVMTCNVELPWLVMAVWIVAGLLAMAGALTYAELSAMMPRAGGEYVFIREAYGRLAGFLFGWMRFFIGNTGGMAALAFGLGHLPERGDWRCVEHDAGRRAPGHDAGLARRHQGRRDCRHPAGHRHQLRRRLGGRHRRLGASWR